MKKLTQGILTLSLFFILLLSFNSLLAQGSNSYLVQYKGYFNNNESSTPNTIFKGNLYITAIGSEYWQSGIKNPLSKDTNFTVKPMHSGVKGLNVFKSKKDSRIYFLGYSAYLPKNEFFYDDLKLQSWVLLPDKKVIDSVPCSKAATIFRNRIYTAWYADNIPLQEGPWKLNGLPGLIIEAYDESRYVYWKVSEITQLNEEYKIEFPKAERAFSEMKAQYLKNFFKFKQSMEAPEGIDPNCASCKESKKTVSATTLEYLQVP